MKDSWHSALGILAHLHRDNGEGPHDPSASSWETRIGLDAAPSEMETDREVEAALPVPLVVEAGPTSSDRREIPNWVQ